MKIDGTTKLYGIIGWPVKHSLSPLFQSLFLKQAEINGAYLPFAVAPELLTEAMAGLKALGIEGFNVTVPHKESVFAMVDADADARLIGAVNTVRRGEFGWEATNTDWRGFRDVAEGLVADDEGGTALLFGAGGTAKAVLHALDALKYKRVLICNRNPDRLSAFIRFAAANYPRLLCEPVAWEQGAVTAASEESQLLAHTTTIGLDGTPDFPFLLSGEGVAIDAVYRPDGMTAFCSAAVGRTAVDGLPMLIAQGAASFAWWHGCDRPDSYSALRFVEQHLGREPLALPGWMAS